MERPTRIRRSKLEKISPDREKFQLHLANDNENKVILNLKNIYYLSSSSSNLVSFAPLNNHEIYYNNEKKGSMRSLHE